MNTFSEQEHTSTLIAPTIPTAIFDEDHQGLVPVSLLTQPLMVEFELWPDVRRGDRYQLLWNNTLIGVIKTITEEQPGASLLLEVPVQFLTQGIHHVAYRVTDAEHGLHADSEFVYVEIDLTAPGLPELGPMKFPDEINCGLTSAELANLGDQLVARIGSYAGIYQHDVIRTYWGDIEGPGAVVSKTDSGLNRIEVTCTKDFLLSLGDFDGFVTYTVTDRAGNISEPSLGAPIRLLLNDALECFKYLTSAEQVNPVRHSNHVVDITLRLQSAVSIPNK